MNYENKFILADCMDVLPDIPENSIDSIVTDPPYGLSFMGSGSTGKACKLESFNFVRIEKDPDYYEIAKARIENKKDEVCFTDDLKLFTKQ